MAPAKEEPAGPPLKKIRRRCAKCATPKPETHFKNDSAEFTPYCAGCRGRFPSLAARVLLVTKRPASRPR